MFKYTQSTFTAPLIFWGYFLIQNSFCFLCSSYQKKSAHCQKFLPTKSVQIGQSDGPKPLWADRMFMQEITQTVRGARKKVALLLLLIETIYSTVLWYVMCIVQFLVKIIGNCVVCNLFFVMGSMFCDVQCIFQCEMSTAICSVKQSVQFKLQCELYC